MPLPFHPSRAAVAAFTGCEYLGLPHPAFNFRSTNGETSAGAVQAIKSLAPSSKPRCDMLLSGWMPLPFGHAAAFGGARTVRILLAPRLFLSLMFSAQHP
jgi:hypothetical protein